MLRPCPSCHGPDVEREKSHGWTNRVVTGRLSRVAVTAARTPRVGRTEGKGRRTFSVARNLGPARGASATARTPRAGSAVSRGVAAHVAPLDAQTEAIAALAVPGTAVDPCVSRDGSGHSGDRPTGTHSARFVGRRVTRPTALLGAFCAGRCADLCFFFDNSASFTNQPKPPFALSNRGRRVSDVRARNSPVCKLMRHNTRTCEPVRTSREHGRAD